MTYKSLLVHLDDDASCVHRVEFAAALARRFTSRLVGVYVVPTPALTPSVAALLPAATVERRLVRTGDEQQRAETLFMRGTASLPNADVEFRAPAGDALDAAVAHASCADLAILAQPDADASGTGFTRRLAEHVMLGSGVPVLMLPYAAPVAEPGRNVLIAWDGGREAARAVRDALPMLAHAAIVTVVSAPREPAAAEALAQSHRRLAGYLDAHGIRAQFKYIEAGGLETADRLLSQVADLGADLVVMGGYAHARAREFVLGGITRTMLESMTVPVLMSH